MIAGPWQMGKVDQGVFTYWMLAHHFRRPLRYIGFGGTGKQVRDLLHVEDLVDLLDEQLPIRSAGTGSKVNVGGGRDCSLSLLETTGLCARDHRQPDLEIGSETADPAGRCARLHLRLPAAVRAHRLAAPAVGPPEILADIHAWIASTRSRRRAAARARAPRRPDT